MKNKINLGNFNGWNLYYDSEYYYAEKEDDYRSINHDQIVFGDISLVFSELKNRVKDYRKKEKDKEKANKNPT